jgi:hypothetical protein
MTRRLLACAFALAVAAPAYALEPLNQETHINDSLRAARIGDVIRKTCPTIRARMLVVIQKAGELEDYALAQGYSQDEVDAFVKNDAEKDRIKAEAAAWLAEAGAVEGDPESYCAVGEAEIAKDSLVGTLLRSTK